MTITKLCVLFGLTLLLAGTPFSEALEQDKLVNTKENEAVVLATKILQPSAQPRNVIKEQKITATAPKSEKEVLEQHLKSGDFAAGPIIVRKHHMILFSGIIILGLLVFYAIKGALIKLSNLSSRKNEARRDEWDHDYVPLGERTKYKLRLEELGGGHEVKKLLDDDVYSNDDKIASVSTYASSDRQEDIEDGLGFKPFIMGAESLRCYKAFSNE